MSNFFGIIILNGSSELVDYAKGAENVGKLMLEYENYYFPYLFTNINEYETFLSLYI